MPKHLPTKLELVAVVASAITLKKTKEAFAGQGSMSNVAARIMGQPSALKEDLEEAAHQVEGWLKDLRAADPKRTESQLCLYILKRLEQEEVRRGIRPPGPKLHGKDLCEKAPHDPGKTGYLHDADDDRPYDVDGVLYCGRCHYWIG